MMNIVRMARLAAAALFALALIGCAHPISVTSDSTPERVESSLVAKTVAYALSDTERAVQVTTPGGGGDKVSYFPYRDLEKSVRDALRAVYRDVVVVKSAKDSEAIKAAGAQLVFTPQIKTDSSSPSAFTWPPTKFSIEISCAVTDASGAELAQLTAAGSGNAEFSEFKQNFGLSAQRAANDVSRNLAQAIRSHDKLR
jgi:hypothetical protein